MKELIEINIKTKIIKKLSKLDLNIIEKGILIVYSRWSGPAISNCSNTLNMLKEIDYLGNILLIDIDNIPYDSQINILGQVCQGWGESFEIENGKIIKTFAGKESYKEIMNNFKNQFR